MKRYVKDTNDIVDYLVNWSPFLGTDTISDSIWIPDHNLWKATTSYPVGTIARLSTNEILEVTVAGISASSQPSPPAVGSTVADGTVTWLRSFSVASEIETATTTIVWIRGGTINKEYGITNHVTTLNGRQADETLIFVIIEK